MQIERLILVRSLRRPGAQRGSHTRSTPHKWDRPAPDRLPILGRLSGSRPACPPRCRRPHRRFGCPFRSGRGSEPIWPSPGSTTPSRTCSSFQASSFRSVCIRRCLLTSLPASWSWHSFPSRWWHAATTSSTKFWMRPLIACIRSSAAAPAARGLIHTGVAYAQWLAMMAAGIGLGLAISRMFAIVALMLWVMGCLYNFRRSAPRMSPTSMCLPNR